MITVLFSCRECGLTDEPCRVPARQSPDINVVKWLEGVLIPAVDRQHTIKSLLCEAKEISNLKIPVPKDDPDAWIGKQTDVVPPKGPVPEKSQGAA